MNFLRLTCINPVVTAINPHNKDALYNYNPQPQEYQKTEKDKKVTNKWSKSCL